MPSLTINLGECTVNSVGGNPICAGSGQLGEEGLIVVFVSHWADARRIMSGSAKVTSGGGAHFTAKIMCYDDSRVELLKTSDSSPNLEQGRPTTSEAPVELTCDIMDRLHEKAVPRQQRDFPPAS